MSKAKKHVWRADGTQRFRVIGEPRFVRRVGYALTWESFFDEFAQPDVLKKVCDAAGVPCPSYFGKPTVNRAGREIAHALAHLKAAHLGFGGPERAVRFWDKESLAKQAWIHDVERFLDYPTGGRTYLVGEVKHRRTGVRREGAQWTMDGDYEPNYLADTKVVTILHPYKGCEYGFLSTDCEPVDVEGNPLEAV